MQDLPTVPQKARPLAVLGRYDVVVIGGGTGGAPAGIAAARRGARTLVVEMHHALGGVGTLGAIANYYHGYRGGFTAEVQGGLSRWAIEGKMEWWRTALRKAGAEIWFGAIGCGAVVHDGRIVGAVVATPHGRGVVLAKVVIDATGNADVAAAAGVPCVYTDASHIAMQGTGMPPRRLGAAYTNTDFTIVDETDMLDVWRTSVYAKHKYGRPFDISGFIDTRERRRIAGEFTLSIRDQLVSRTYPDTIAQAATNYDTHGYTVHPLFELSHPSGRYTCHIPYRCLLPKGYEGLLVVGIGISAERDAQPLIRMQPDVQNLGYAAGWAAAMAAEADTIPRRIDIKQLQKHLAKIGCVPQSVLTDRDSFPLPAARVAEAVKSAANNYKNIAVILSNPKQALPLLKQAYSSAKSKEDRIAYAHILGAMGDATGADVLIESVTSAEKFDKGWRYRGMGQFGRNMSFLDARMVALGRIGDRRATPAIVAKLRLLTDKEAFSHFRAVAMALEGLKDPAAAGALAEVLQRPGIRGQVIADVQKAIERGGKGKSINDNTVRAAGIRELMLARALYRCGDKDGLGKKILDEYSRDLRGHLARHARAILREKK